jgi:hypothetical protein
LDFKRRFSWLVFCLTLISLLVLYVPMLPERLTAMNNGQDQGDFLAAVLSGGIPHPSGYPTFLLLASLFQLIPFSTPVWRGALLSALCVSAAGALTAVWVAQRFLEAGRLPKTAGLWAWLGVLVWGSLPLVWGQALLVEVYGLQTLFNVLCIGWLWVLAFSDAPVPGRLGLALAFATGLGAGNHLTLGLMVPAVVWAFVMAWRKGQKMGWLLAHLVSAIAGLLVYSVLPLRASVYPPINWGNPQTLSGFWWLVSGAPYQGLLLGLTGEEILSRISALARMWLDQFGLVGLVLVVMGAFYQDWLPQKMRWLGVWIFGVYTVFSVIYGTPDSQVYMIPALLVACVWLSGALARLAEFRWWNIPWGVLGVLVFAGCLMFQLYQARLQVDPNQDLSLSDYAERLVQQSPPASLIITDRDQDTFPVWYYVVGLKQRPDLRVIVLPLTQFVWYQETLMHAYPDLSFPPVSNEKSTEWGTQLILRNPGRAVCTTHSEPDGKQPPSFSCEIP